MKKTIRSAFYYRNKDKTYRVRSTGPVQFRVDGKKIWRISSRTMIEIKADDRFVEITSVEGEK